MNALELTQRQHELLENIAKAVQQYQQAIADAAARLEHEFEQIEQSRDKERQRIEEERKEKAKITSEIQEIAARRSAITLPKGITTIEAVKGEIDRALSTESIAGGIIDTIGIICVIIVLFIFCAIIPVALFAWEWGTAVAEPAFLIMIFALVIGYVLDKIGSVVNGAFDKSKIALLHGLYDRWLELVDERASAQRAEAQRRYEQAVAQAKGQMLAAAEQLRPAIAEFDALTEQVFPSWESEAWRRWEPESLVPGAVRLGVFKMEV